MVQMMGILLTRLKKGEKKTNQEKKDKKRINFKTILSQGLL